MPARRYTDEHLFELAREAAAEHGVELTLDEFCRHSGVSVRPIASRFGTWRRFRERAGLPPRPAGNERARKYTQTGLADSLRRFAAGAGNDVSLSDFCTRTGVSPSTVYARCGSWGALREAAGLTRRTHGNPRNRRRTPQELIERLESLARRHGVDITLTEFTAWTGISTTVIYARFGSWSKLRAAADLPEQGKPRRRYSDDFLLRDLHRVHRLRGRFPTMADYKTYGHANPQTLVQRFGGKWDAVRFASERWVEAMRNPTPRPVGKLTPEEHRRLLELDDAIQRQVNGAAGG